MKPKNVEERPIGEDELPLEGVVLGFKHGSRHWYRSGGLRRQQSRQMKPVGGWAAGSEGIIWRPGIVRNRCRLALHR